MYQIVYAITKSQKNFEKIPQSIKLVIKKAIEKKLTTNPLEVGKPLRYDLKGYRRLRVADYRVIYRVDQDKVIVVIVEIDHRKDVYD
jgi:addiction module toxin, RelE/StbE family